MRLRNVPDGRLFHFDGKTNIYKLLLSFPSVVYYQRCDREGNCYGANFRVFGTYLEKTVQLIPKKR